VGLIRSLYKGVSTSSNHPAAEDRLYANAERAVQESEIQMFLHGYLKSLRGRYQVVNYMST